MRPYVVLRAHPRQDSPTGDATPTDFTLVQELEASNADNACRQAAKLLPDGDLGAGVELIAIPARNWSPTRFQAQTTTRLVAS